MQVLVAQLRDKSKRRDSLECQENPPVVRQRHGRCCNQLEFVLVVSPSSPKFLKTDQGSHVRSQKAHQIRQRTEGGEAAYQARTRSRTVAQYINVG
jgi:hypothetical protein